MMLIKQISDDIEREKENKNSPLHQKKLILEFFELNFFSLKVYDNHL
jgi:hypothetical protein